MKTTINNTIAFCIALLLSATGLSAQETIYKATFPQNGKAPAIIISASNIQAAYLDSLMTVEIASNVDFKVTSQAEWIKVVKFSDNYLYLKTAQNETDLSRTGTVEVAQAGGAEKKTVKITQAKSNPASFIKGDIKIKVAGGTASQAQSGEDISKSYDGDFGTLYHSPYSGTSFPVTLTYNFTNVQVIDYMVYHPRRSGDNGNFDEIEVSYKRTGDADYVVHGNYKLNGSSNPFKIEFPGGLENPTNIRIKVKSGKGNWASCAEMEFYKKNDSNTALFELFEDAICSKLKPNVTDAQIEALYNPFAKKLAKTIKSGTYNTEFRVNEFEAFPTLNETAKWMKTSDYNRYENATGIYFDEGDEIVVFVENTGTESVALLIQNQNPAESGNSTYFLSNGINKIKAANKGQGYVNYYTTNWKQAPNVKIHFAMSKVTGYFDLEKYRTATGYDLPTANREWTRILAGAVSPMFDVVSKRHHTCYPTAGFREHNINNGANFALAMDSIVYRTHEIMGLLKYDKEPKNRQYSRSTTGGMFADGIGAGIPNLTSYGYIDVPKLDWWGVTHELGHVNQVRPAMKWVATSEVTNNIYSAYAQHKIGNGAWIKSLGGKPYYRLEHEAHGSSVDVMNGAGGRFNAYLNFGIKDGGKWLMTEGNDYYNQALFSTDMYPNLRRNYDHFVKLAPLWQFTLYFKECGVRPDYWAQVFEAARKLDDSKMSNGALLLNYMRTSIDSTKLNLAPFFEKVGMLREYNDFLEDYSPGQMTITKAQVEELKTYAAGYPAPESPVIYYISAQNWEIFRDKLPLEVDYRDGSTTWAKNVAYSSNIVTVRHNPNSATYNTVRNAVAFETYDKDGKLLRISMRGFRNASNLLTSVLYPNGSARVDAVGWDGTRKTIYDKPN